MAVLEIDPNTLIGLGTLVTTIGTTVVSIIIAIKQNTTTRVARRIEAHTNGLTEQLKEGSYVRGRLEEQVVQAAKNINKETVVVPMGEANVGKD